MQLGLFTPVFNSLSFDALLTELKRYPEISTLELGTGGWPGGSHLNLDALLASKSAAADFLAKLRDADLTISALSCHNNPVHPNPEIAQRDDTTLRKTVQLAESLEVPVVVTFSGCPGASAQDTVPNWITTSWPPEYSEALAWQWEERLIPYWKDTVGFAAKAGVKIALEAHPGFCVYNVETMLRLRAAAGPSLGINLDPSHLWWQGVDIPAAIAALGDAIFHVHAKDTQIFSANLPLTGVLDTKPYTDERHRSWIFRTCGYGHGSEWWKEFVSTLRMFGYDGVLSIEHEDSLLSPEEGLRKAAQFLSEIVIKEQPSAPWWV